MQQLKIVVFGLSITSSWGNGHATTFRSIIKALHRRGHQVTFFEKDVPWYANNRDLPEPPFCQTVLYRSPGEVDRYEDTLAAADMVIIGSYVPDSHTLVEKVRQFTRVCLAYYDIDTPVTLAKLDAGDYEYLHPDTIPEFDIYLSFTGGPSLDRLESRWSARWAQPLYCSVDPDLYYPEPSAAAPLEYSLGYLGTYSDDRQPTVQSLLIDAAERLPESRFCVAGAQYPREINWPANVMHIEHIPPRQHRHFYNGQRFTLNVTRQNMIAAGYSPSVRLFEAGACGTPVISDYWEGLDELFTIGEEILVARSTEEAVAYLQMDEVNRRAIGERMRNKVMRQHTADHRAKELENYWRQSAMPPLATTATGSSIAAGR